MGQHFWTGAIRARAIFFEDVLQAKMSYAERSPAMAPLVNQSAHLFLKRTGEVARANLDPGKRWNQSEDAGLAIRFVKLTAAIFHAAHVAPNATHHLFHILNVFLMGRGVEINIKIFFEPGNNQGIVRTQQLMGFFNVVLRGSVGQIQSGEIFRRAFDCIQSMSRSGAE